MSKDNLNVIPVVLCGGSGTRLWPLSRENYPKQFLSLVGDRSLFQQTLYRLTHIELKLDKPIVVTNESQRFLLLDELHSINCQAQIILEPTAKNTAPALTLVSLLATENNKDEDVILIVLPADHSIKNEMAFGRVVNNAVEVIKNNPKSIVTLGIQPTKAETGFGYIQFDKGVVGTYQEYRVKQFVEKPNIEIAKNYVQSGEYVWNAGIFVLTAKTWLHLIEQCQVDMYNSINLSWQQRKLDNPFIRPEKTAFESADGNSIDYAVIEKCANLNVPIYMIPLSAGWSDLGSWQSVSEQQDLDDAMNSVLGDVIVIDSKNSLVQAHHRLVAMVGVDDVVVVETTDAVLVVNKNKTQDVKKVVETLKNSQRNEGMHHRKVHRPWGWYDSIEQAERFKVKRICVKPKASLSLQKHYHRAEHWIVVKGTAEVTCGDKTVILTENQSTYIPLGKVHRLSNPGHIPLEIIEIQTGSYLEEDDIVRFDDVYGR